MAKRALSDDDGVAEVSGADQHAFSPSKRRQPDDASGDSDVGDSSSVAAENRSGDAAQGVEAVAAGDMAVVGDAMETANGEANAPRDDVEAAVDTCVDQEEPTDEDESGAFRTDLELNAVFAHHHHHAAADLGGDASAADAEPESEEAIEPMQVDHASVSAAAVDGYDEATTITEASGVNGDLASTPMVVAPMFPPVHRSWEAFEQSLKEYAHATFQQYVVRTTTSVKRRNQRITENASSSSSSSFLPSAAPLEAPVREVLQGDVDDQNADSTAQDTTEDGRPEQEVDASSASALVSKEAGNLAAPSSDEAATQQQQQLIPESYQWYSKTLMCTHGWKDRNRGSGKRSLSVVRSTSCPAKMCVTLQHRGKGDDGWQVVLTRHVRTHNHQLSKELYLYYMENRRIYDPDLLQVPGSPSTNPPPALAQQQQQRSKGRLSHLLVNSEDQQQLRLQTTGNNREDAAQNSFQAPRALVKSHESWEHFHNYIAEYSTLSNQSFRSRSTVSVVAKNLKTKTLALKAGRSADEITAQLIPESERWYSKMLICNHGWKRKSRSKAQKDTSTAANRQDDELSLENSCPAMLMARLQRDVNDSWRVVINRQVLDHNHSPLRLVVAGSTSATQSALASQIHAQVTVDQQQVQESSSQQSTLHFFGGDMAGTLNVSQQDHLGNGAALEQRPGSLQQHLEKGEIVVRVPKLEAVHASWEAFHARLQEYSDATFQLYRTRTTSSVQGRNQKIPDMKRSSSSADTLALGEAGSVSQLPPTDTRTIPEEWKWYSKTLTCTHGWKERRRGTGKRTVQVFRSTACPVKICATVQFVENAHSEEDEAGNDANRGEGGGSWRVVVTKHVVDHNHNLSKELHQHYCENRRIYDPNLLTIDESNASVVTKPRKIPHKHHQHQHHNFLLGGSEDQQAFHQQHGGSAVASVAMDVNSAGGNAMQHPFGPLGDASLHSGGQMASNSGGHDLTGDDGSFATHPGASSTSGLSASLSSFSGAFPSLAGSHALFRTASHPQQNPPFLLHAHQYFAVDQSMNLGFAASQFHIPTIGNPGIRESASAPSFAVGASSSSSSSFLAAPCRVHSSGGVGIQLTQRLNDGGLQCTCFRGATTNVAKPPSAQPRQQTTVSPSAPVRSAAKQKQISSQRVVQNDDHQHQHDDFDNDDDEGEGSPPGGATTAWAPTMDPEILTLTSVSGVTFYRAPKIKRLHTTWDEFQEYLEAYSVATYQLFRVRTTSSVSSRNTRIAQQAVDRDAPTPVGASEGGATDLLAPSPLLVPESYQWYSKTFVCTHGWKSRSRGKGQRKSHNLRSTACPAKLCVTLQRVLHETNKWHVVVTRQGTDHNHEISAAAYQQYSEVRRIRDASLLEQAEELWKKGMTRRKVFEFLKEQAPNILMKDVHNLVQRWQTRYGKANNSETGALETAAASEGADVVVDSDNAQPAPTTQEANQEDTNMQQHEFQDM